MTVGILIVAVLCLAFANGSNDNFKGVATLFGSQTTNYRLALSWATVTTLLGSLAAVALASTLLKSFSGKGLVDVELAKTTIASWIGMPISTTHSLIGALLGAGWAAGSAINFDKLASGFVVPLLISPILAIGCALLLYPAVTRVRKRLGISAETCICVGSRKVQTVPDGGAVASAMTEASELAVELGEPLTCARHYTGRLLGIGVSSLIVAVHYMSAGIVCFARGLNDTPKIAALLLLAPALSNFGAVGLVGIAIAVGGVISARRVAETMSLKITAMNPGQGLTANLITGLIVIGASRLGLPVSTTHVSCGSLFGIGAANGQMQWSTARRVLLAWALTLPLGAIVGSVCFKLLG